MADTNNIQPKRMVNGNFLRPFQPNQLTGKSRSACLIASENIEHATLNAN